MKRLFLLFSLVLIGFTAFSQNTSPLRMVNFSKVTDETVDLKSLKDEIGRDSDYDGNKAALIKVKAQGFSEKVMQEFNPFPRYGIEIIHKKYQDGMMLLYVSSNTHGAMIIKYMGEFEFNIPNKLEPRCVYELVLGMESATLIIRVAPEDAEIYIDDEKVGSGYVSKEVAVGAEHRWKVQLADYWPQEGQEYFDHRDEKTLDIELKPYYGYITIKSEPSGAQIYIDEKKVGVTPYVMKKIKIGQHIVELRKDGYVSAGDVIVINTDEHNKQFEKVKLEKQTVATYVAPVNKNFKFSEFSISSSNKVYFSQGNLQYQASTGLWRFAERQWETVGFDNEKISPTYSGWIDLFYWGRCEDPTNVSKQPVLCDWSNDHISNGEGRSWRVLNLDEWNYLLYKRNTSSGMRFTKANVNDVYGFILFPDDWNKSNYNVREVNNTESVFESNNISKTDWETKLEANGAVFLPETEMHGFGCEYWSTSYIEDRHVRYNTRVKYISFSKKSAGTCSTRDLDEQRLGVRLVSPIVK